MPLRTFRLSLLPPYVLARVDELKSRLRAEGREVYDFGLGNPDGPSPAAVVARLQAELARPGFQRYMPSRGCRRCARRSAPGTASATE
jgi:aspartate/methionine/tyrosine aminotransferase